MHLMINVRKRFREGWSNKKADRDCLNQLFYLTLLAKNDFLISFA